MLVVSGTLNPDVTGNYYEASVYNGKPYYKHVSTSFFIWWNGSNTWYMTLAPGLLTGFRWSRTDPEVTGDYAPYLPATGTATVAEPAEGYIRVYRRQAGDLGNEELVAEMGLDDEQISIINQDLPPGTIWEFLRRRVTHCCEKESADSPFCAVRIDAAGDMLNDIPNVPNRLTIEKLAGGKFKLRWRYTRLAEEIAPTGFYIYVDSGSGFDFGSPDGTVAYNYGGPKAGEFEWTSDAFEHGQLCRFCVRSYRTDAGESQNTNYVSAAADTIGPDAIAGLVASFEEI